MTEPSDERPEPELAAAVGTDHADHIVIEITSWLAKLSARVLDAWSGR